jgi:hypothetical protein
MNWGEIVSDGLNVLMIISGFYMVFFEPNRLRKKAIREGNVTEDGSPILDVNLSQLQTGGLAVMGLGFFWLFSKYGSQLAKMVG